MAEPAPQTALQKFSADVKLNVVPLLGGEQHWDKWAVALRAACLKTPGIMQALQKNPATVLLALVKCAQLGLSPEPGLQHFALAPFGGAVEGLVMYKGWMHLAQTSGNVEWIHADVVYRGEVVPGIPFVDMATGRVNHVAEVFQRDDWKDSDIVGAYCVVKVRGTERLVPHVMSRGQIEKRRQMGGKSSTWVKWYPQMCMAKVIGACLRSGRVPLSKRLQDALELEDRVVAAEATVVDTPANPRAPRSLAAPAGPSGAEVLFEAREAEPFPTEDQHAEDMRRAVVAEMDRQKLDEKARAAAIAVVGGDGCTLDQLLADELGALLDYLTQGGE